MLTMLNYKAYKDENRLTTKYNNRWTNTDEAHMKIGVLYEPAFQN